MRVCDVHYYHNNVTLHHKRHLDKYLLINFCVCSADPSIMIKNWDLNTVTLMLHSISSESVGTVQSRFYNTLLLLIISCSIHTRKKSSEDCSIIKNPCIISCSIILFKHSRIRIRHWEDCFIAASFFNRCIALYQWCIIRGDHMDKHFE